MPLLFSFVLDASRSPIFDEQPGYLCAHDNLQVLPIQSSAEVGGRGALPPAVCDRAIRATESFLASAIGILADRISATRCSFHPRATYRRHLRNRWRPQHADWSITTTIF